MFNEIIHKIFCFFGLHIRNIVKVTSTVHLECVYCNKEFRSYKKEDYIKADKLKKTFETEQLLTREVLIEKRSRFNIELEKMVKRIMLKNNIFNNNY